MRRLLPLLLALVACGVAAPPPAPASPAPAPPAVVREGVVAGGQTLALFGRTRYGGRFGYGRRSPYGGYRSRRYGYGYGRRGHGFLHGLFWGWMLGHFFGVGVPVFPLLLILLLVAMLLRRGPRRAGPRW